MQHIYSRNGYKKTHASNYGALTHKRAKKAIQGMHHSDEVALGHDARQKPLGLHKKSMFTSYDLFKEQ